MVRLETIGDREGVAWTSWAVQSRHVRPFTAKKERDKQTTHTVELVVSHVGSGRGRQPVVRTILVPVDVSREDRLVESLQSLVALLLLLLSSLPELKDGHEEDH